MEQHTQNVQITVKLCKKTKRIYIIDLPNLVAQEISRLNHPLQKTCQLLFYFLPANTEHKNQFYHKNTTLQSLECLTFFKTFHFSLFTCNVMSS